ASVGCNIRVGRAAIPPGSRGATMGDSDEVQIEPALAATEEVRSLVGELEAVLSTEYSPEQRHGSTLDAIFQPQFRFFLARLRGTAVGCGGVYLFPDFAEVKRMYVRY